ncbi:MAG: glutamate racemase [Sneathiellales bacterium]|nr:glutamate racemase [Sneathiellales bacterium]
MTHHQKLSGEGFQAFSVLVLDSGIGGLSIVSAFRDVLPGLAITYIADTACFPYGSLSEKDLDDRLTQLVSTAFHQRVFDAVVIACNTASTVVLESLRQQIDRPVIGVVPPIKTAGEQSKSRKIALLSTVGTANRAYIQNLSNAFAPDCDILTIGCSCLASLAEEKLRGRTVDVNLLRNDIADLLSDAANGIDTVILGCTHFPFLKEELECELGREVIWLEPAVPVARHLKSLLQKTAPLLKSQDYTENVFLHTGSASELEGLENTLTEKGFTGCRPFDEIVA